MKKGLKIGMLTMAFLAAMTAVISTGKVEAQTTNNDNIVQVKIEQYNSGQNTCTGTDYLIQFNAAITEQSGSKDGTFTCQLGNSAAVAITLQLQGDLTSAEGATLSGENIKLFTIGTWTSTPNELGSAGTIGSGGALKGVPQTLFNKAEKKIGDASGDATILVTVPAGQPDGTYTGTLVLTF